LAWNSGVTLCVAPDEFMAKDLQAIVNSMGVTHLHLTPTLASHLDPQTVPSVQYLATFGEPLNAKVHQDWAGKNLYHGISTRVICLNLDSIHLLIH
jgi:acyl-coenzyme A synthetase/AMP-(fatty) acid ligase